MIISYYIFIISISILSKLSDFTEINSTNEFQEVNGNRNIIKENESISDIVKNITIDSDSDNTNNDIGEKLDVPENKSSENEPTSENIPRLYDKNITDQEIIDVSENTTDKIETINITSSHDHSQLGNKTETQSNTDDMPTFDEYRQKLEKESKQKREKADSIPSSPTMIDKDRNVVKSSLDSVVIKSSNKEGTESIGSALPVTQETKNQATVEKNDGKSFQILESTKEIKVVARTATLTKKLLKNNVAAKECGAKVLDFSRQMTNADHVLNNNKDEYLNVPCSLNEKWFVIETCEPVQIRSLQIANFEMFSSRPKTFKVYSSDRYPAKHWNNLGLFRAHDEKGIQTFTISDSNMVKYIKFEMVDHYGNEHYCPLTFVRILGNVVIDEIDEEAEYSDPSVDDDAPVGNFDEKVNSDGLLMKAKDILVKMVNGIGGSKKEDLDQSIQDLTSITKKLDDSSADLIVSESPCYFIDFLNREVQLNWDKILLNFQRILELEKFLTFHSNMTLENCIVSQPFPFQIRMDYFSIQQMINNTSFQFHRLYMSFFNLTLHSSQDISFHKPLQNLSSIFKCNLDLNKDSRFFEPNLPKIMPDVPVLSEIPVSNIPPTASIPDVKTSEQVTGEPNSWQSSGQSELPDFNGQGKSSTSTLPSLSSNETVIEELSNFDRNNVTLESANKDQRVNKTNFQTKESEFDNANKTTDSQSKANLAKPKPDEIFDQKFPASPGSNAWNQAFMRIKNMAKQLEVNVSISMKYLEELSQNYKQQTERLKKAQFSMAENVSNLENLIHQYREETQQSLQSVNTQLQSLILKMKYRFSSMKHVKAKGTTSVNLSDNLANEVKCVDLLSDELFETSWSDSPYFLVFINVTLSMFCNLVLLSFVYNRLKVKIISDVTKSTMLPLNSNFNRNVQFSYIEDLSMCSSSRSCGDLTNPSVIYPHPVVLPPRGVNLSFTNSEYISDHEMRINHNTFQKELGPHFYPVQPNLNFVTPSKDRKKKRKR